jgi:type I restriction enzyme S subunit
MLDVPKIDIRPDHWEIVQGILKKHVPLCEVWAFGSRAKWTAKEYSDLDLAIITDHPLSLDVSASLSDDFSESDLPWRVDVVDWATTSESFRKIMERDKVVVQEGKKRGRGMGEWQRYRLDELCEFINGFAFKSTDYVPASVDTIEVFRMGYIERGGGFKEDDRPVFVPKKYGKKLDKYFLRVGDVTIAMTDMKDRVAILGNTAWIRDENRFVLNQRVGCIRVKQDDLLDPRFLYFYSNWEPHVDYLRSRANSGVQVNLATSAIKDAELCIPPLVEQRAIAHILGTLDDKIELNRKQNETLEAMARALFKAWFVDFEPVRAKMEGRWVRGQSLPGLPAHLFDLFPDKLVESELGEIPEGWQIMRIGDIGDVICGKTPSTQAADYYGEDIPFITIPEMHGNIFACGIKKRLSLKGAESQIKKMLPSGAICVSCIATLGLVNITTEPSQTNQQINSVVPAEEKETYFWYWTLKNMREAIKAGGSGGSVLDNLSIGRFVELQVNASIGALRLAYNSSVGNLFSQILANATESQTLCQLRDALLPKLISGELRVPEAIKEAEA